MNLKKLPFPIYGNPKWRGKCPLESAEQITFFNQLRKAYPETWGALALHPRNEQQLRGGQHRGMIKQKAEGMTPGASELLYLDGLLSCVKSSALITRRANGNRGKSST